MQTKDEVRKARLEKKVMEIAGRVGATENANDDVTGRTINTLELAGKLQSSEREIRKLVAAKKIPVIRVGRLVRFYFPDVVRALTVPAALNGGVQ